MPVSCEEIGVFRPVTERQALDGLELDNCTIHYVRIPVADHLDRPAARGRERAGALAMGQGVPGRAGAADHDDLRDGTHARRPVDRRRRLVGRVEVCGREA